MESLAHEMSEKCTLILGGGVSGLACGLVSGFPVYEAAADPGGICSSYYVAPGSDPRPAEPPPRSEAYRFERGGGHWIFGGDSSVLRFLEDLSPLRRYTRNSGVYFAGRDLLVPYPLQDNLSDLGEEIAARALVEMGARGKEEGSTFAEWLDWKFGPTLGDLFFAPFHEKYTAGLWKRIAPQDSHKSPTPAPAQKAREATGYNATFAYPENGLDELIRAMADRCALHCGKRAVKVHCDDKTVEFGDGSSVRYERLVSTIPLVAMEKLSGVSPAVPRDPYSSVLVFNLGARRGSMTPREHWIYVPDSTSGFHRVGFYSNVDESFLPANACDRVSLYVEFGFPGSERPVPDLVDSMAREMIAELQSWDFIGELEVMDSTWIDVAYTWAWPRSEWAPSLLRELEGRDIFMIGRYGRWAFQGIADSIRDGLRAGSALSSGITA